MTDWEVLGGPVTGFHYKKHSSEGMSEFGLVVGDICSPKYLTSRTLNLNLGEKRIFKFYWQVSYLEYFTTCLTKGLFVIKNP